MPLGAVLGVFFCPANVGSGWRRRGWRCFVGMWQFEHGLSDRAELDGHRPAQPSPRRSLVGCYVTCDPRQRAAIVTARLGA
jgi:hypothetical protein